jgi:hypothetical protein
VLMTGLEIGSESRVDWEKTKAILRAFRGR